MIKDSAGMNIVIVGAGKVGSAIAMELAKEKHDLTVIDVNADKINEISNTLDVITLNGNGASYDTLREAGADKADLLIAITGADEINLLCCITARKLGAAHTIARVRNPEYDRQMFFLREELGLSLAINPEQAAADEISRLLSLPSASRVDSFSRGGLELAEFRVTPESKLDGMALSNLQTLCKAKVLVCAIERDEKVYIPKGSFVLKAMDKLNIIGASNEVYSFFNNIGALRHRIKNVVILGGGKISIYLAKQIIDIGMKVKVIEQKAERCAELKKAVPKASVILGNGTKPELLTEEGIGDADAFIALTGYDENNIITALYAASQGAGKVIVKVNESHIIKMMSGMQLDSFVQPKQLVSQRIIQYVRAMQNAYGISVETLYPLFDGRIEALEFIVSSSFKYINKPLKSLPIRQGVLVAAINRGRRSFIPNGEDYLAEGDSVVVVSDTRGMQRLEEIVTAV
jgi:trk system potassium uptake protein TrkA